MSMLKNMNFFEWWNYRHFRYCEMLWLNIKIFEYFGYLRPKSFDTNWMFIIIYHTWSIISWCSGMGSLLFLQGMACIKYWPNTDLITGALFIFLTNFTTTLKLINFFHRKELIYLTFNYFVNSLKNELNDPEILGIIRKYEKIAFRDFFVYFSWGTLTCIVWAIIGDVSGDPNNLPLVSWYPFQINGFPIYHLAYFQQMGAVTICCWSCVLTDVLSTNMCGQICCQLELIHKYIRDIEIVNNTMSENNTNNKLELLPENLIYTRLSLIIERHSILLNVSYNLNSIIGWTIFIQFGISSSIVCLCLYQFAVNENQNSITFMVMIGYLLAMLMQLFLYCHYGNKIIILSSLTSIEASNISWYLFTNKCRKSLLRLIQQSQIPIILKAGNLLPLTMETFTRILRMSYSFFSLLKTVD